MRRPCGRSRARSAWNPSRSCASPSKRPLPSDRKRRWKKGALAVYRLGVLLAALACLRLLPTESPGTDPARILTEAQAVFPACASLGEPADGIYPLLDADGGSLGWITSTHPQAGNIQGYSGP